jgi:CRP-like cAMP-binding protein
MKAIEDLLAELPFFSDLDPSYRRLVAGCGRNHTFRNREMLMKQGDDADQFFVIRRGKVALHLHLAERGEVTIATLDPGEIVGLSWLFPPYKVQFDARSIGLVSVIAFDAACLRDKCDADPVLGYDLMKRFTRTIMARLQATRLQYLDMYGTRS